MKKIGILIRRSYSSNYKKILKKEIKNLHRRIKKNDQIQTDYVIEKDNDRDNYHTHLLIQYNDEKNLFQNLSRFIGSDTWTIDKNGLDTIKINQGMWGEVRTHNIYDEDGFQNYMNKHQMTETLI